MADGSYTPHETVTIIVRRKISTFSEDLRRSKIQPRRTRKVAKTPPKPHSVTLGKHYLRFKAGEIKADSQVVLGCYFTVYKDMFGEEDPEWAGEKVVKPLYNITAMAHVVCDGDFSQLVEFVETLIPLWAERLRAGSEFPSTRPTTDTLFLRRKMWAQRFNLYNRWKS